MRCYPAPLVLEGGAFLVDGEGTLVTTDQCLLNPNRNPDLSREQVEQALYDYLGVSTVVWLDRGHHSDTGPEGTDGHVDGIAQYVSPGRLLLEVPADPAHPGHAGAVVNLDRLAAAADAQGRRIDVIRLDPGTELDAAYANLYVANGGVVVPVAGGANDGPAPEQIAAAFRDREVLAVPGEGSRSAVAVRTASPSRSRRAPSSRRDRNRQPRQGRTREDLLVAAAVEVIAERGLANVRVADIAERAGDGARPRHVLLPVQGAAADATVDEPWQRLQTYLELATPDRPGDPGWVLWFEVWAGAALDPQVAQAHQELDGRSREILADIIRYGCDRGAFGTADPDAASLLLPALIDGLSIQLTLGAAGLTRADLLRLVAQAARAQLEPPAGSG